MDRLRACIMGCTGLVGQQFIKMLEGHPYFEISALSSSPRTAGKKYSDAVDWMVGGKIPEAVRDLTILKTSSELLLKEEIHLAFSALPSTVAKDIERALAREGVYIFSNASAHRMGGNIPILIPEVNPEHLTLIQAQMARQRGFIVTNSNCSTAGLALGLKPLEPFGLKSVVLTTYQALSGAGRHGLPSLDILDNVIPYIREEEEKIERETKKIFGKLHKEGIQEAYLEVNTSCCRVPTRDGHLESIVTELEREVSVEAVSDALRTFRGIPQEMKLPTAPEVPVIVSIEKDRPQPLLDRNAGTPDRAKGMAVTVGRIRKKGGKINFFLLVHNTIRGAAGTCILNAEFAFMKNCLK